jgi:hypothetical protein
VTFAAAAAYNTYMKRCSTVVLLTAAVIALAGCGAGKRVSSRAPVVHLGPLVAKAAIPGPQLTPVPAGYRTPLSSRALRDRIPQIVSINGRVSHPVGNPTAHLWTVNGAYPAWVFTAHGSAGKSVAIYDLRGRRWTMSYLVPRHGSPGCGKGFCGWPVNQGGLDMAAGAAERIAGAAHVFGGVRIDDAADRVVLELKHAPPSVIDQLNASHPGTYVIHNNVTRTLADVMKVERSLDFTALKAKGIDIVSAGPNGAGKLIVGVTKDIPKAQAYFDATYGQGFVRVVHGEPAMPT